MKINIQYKDAQLVFEHIPNAQEIEEAYDRHQASALKNHGFCDEYPLSLAQQQIWFQEQLYPGTTMFNVPLAFAINDSLNVRAFCQAIDELIKRHEILKSKIHTIDTVPYFFHDNENSPQVLIIDLSYYETKTAESECERRQQNILNTVFDFKQSLVKFELIKKSEHSYLFFALFHHLIIDQQSVNIFFTELFELYAKFNQAHEGSLEYLDLRFSDFVLWEKNKLQAKAFNKEKAILLKRFSGELPKLDLFPDFPRLEEPCYQGSFRSFILEDQLAKKIRQAASTYNCTPYILALSALAIVLSRHAEQSDVIIGTPFSGRTDEQLKGLMGLFVSLQPIRLDLSNKKLSFYEFIQHTRERVLEAEECQNYPLLQLLSDLPAIERQAGSAPLFQVIFSYETGLVNYKNPAKLEIVPLNFSPTSAKFDVSFTFLERENKSILAADFRSDLFEKETIEAILQHWAAMLESLCDRPSALIASTPLLNADEQHALIACFNQHDIKYPPSASIHKLVEDMVSRHHKDIAIIHNERKISYESLDQHAQFLAHKLKQQGAKPGDIIVLFFDRGPEAVAAMLAVLKIGAAYLPLDPKDPPARLRTIIADSQASIGVCQEYYKSVAEESNLRAIIAEQGSVNNFLSIERKADDLMSVLYTSGSTGNPKGVMLHHGGMMRLCHQANFIDLGPSDRVAQLCPLNFDGALFEIWGALTSGATLVIIDKDKVLSPTDLGKEIGEHHLTTLIITTPLLNRLIEDAPFALRDLKNIVFGGEIISKPHMSKALEYCKPGVLIHTYGPTENSFTSCYYRIFSVDMNRWTIPIGQPVSQTEIYILDEQLGPVPFGVVGEIYLSGSGLALGYLNDPEKTREAFIANPFAHNLATQKLYRTKDRGRRLRNGLIEFVGRTDNQIKIRSQRVELGEVEQALRKNSYVKECFVSVIKSENNEKQIIAYFVLSVPESPDIIPHIRRSMQQLLPDYMVPVHFIALDTLILNENGKVKRSALPKPNNIIKAPNRNESLGSLELKIKTIWQEILGLNDISIHDNFFEIGGHSLSLVKLQSGIKSATGLALAIADFFKYTTIKSLSDAINNILYPQNKTKFEIIESSFLESNDNHIAIIGMAIRAPMAGNIYEFWDNIRSGKNCITTFSEKEVDEPIRALFEPHGSAWVRAGGLLDTIYAFDPHYFGLSEYEARLMDPQMRILLECVADALDNAALDRKARNSALSLYVGATPNTYGQKDSKYSSEISGAESLVAQANSHSVFMATRISHNLNLKGESIMVDTLCSTSLVAVHMACASLLTGMSDYALAGGVTVQTPQKVGYLYEPNFIMSPNGQCRAFDADACGTVPGNGAGIVLMRRLKDALRDKDPIHAIIRASAVNNDGRDKMAYYAPSVLGQSQAIVKAQELAQVSPDSISYIEAHGTGTKLGDPIEIQALSDAFRRKTSRRNFCSIGSVKTNIGHLGNAAGVAGLIKAVLALKHRFIPASLNFDAPNKNIDFENSPFFVASTGRPWESDRGPRRAGVSSYGIGGTNAHVIIEEAP